MPLTLTKANNKETGLGRTAVEGQRLLKRIFEHTEEHGAKNELIFGQPESCKTAATCFICNYFMNHHPQDYLFWRSALNAPIQVFKLPRWHLWVEQDSGVHFFDRNTGEDVTEKLKQQRQLSYFRNFEDLLKKAKPGICNGVFFKDLHYKNVHNDKGTLQWFRFIRFLLHRIIWYHVFLDEYQEMVKAYSGERMHWEIDKHSDDVSSARKSNVGVHANAHQTTEIDWRVIPSFMIILQMYGSRLYKHSPIKKSALAALPKPTETNGAEAWISEGGKFGRITFKRVYLLPKGLSIEARIVSADEKTHVCPVCKHIFVYKRMDQEYCGSACKIKAFRNKKVKKKK